MKLRIAYERSVNIAASSLAMVAQRLPFLKNLSPLFGATGGVNFAAPLTVTFVGTHSLSGQSITINPVNGATESATVGVGEQFVWGFKSSRYVMRDVATDTNTADNTLPEGLSLAGPQSGIYFIGGVPTSPGTYEITVTGYRNTNRLGGTTAPYLLTLTVEPDEEPLTPFEEFVATFWSGEDLNDPLLVDPLADPDEDGIENVMEFLLNLDPTKPGTMPGTIGVDAQDPLKIRYEIPLNALANAVTVKFEQSSSLETGWEEVPAGNIERTGERVVLTAPLADKKYYRLRAALDTGE